MHTLNVDSRATAIKASSDDARCDQAKKRIPDDEETEDEDVFKEQQLLKQAQAKRDARVVDRLARLKIDRYKLVGEDKLLVKQCIFKSAKSKQPTVAWPAVV